MDILPGIVTALHLHFKHAAKSQLKLVFSRFFFAIKSDTVIDQLVDKCDLCNSLKAVPAEVFDQSSSMSASSPGQVFYADVLRRNRQKICVVCDVHSSFTTAAIITDESAASLKPALLLNSSFFRAPQCTIRVDSAPGFQALRSDKFLQ